MIEHVAERTSKGLIKVITKPNGQVLGVSVIGPHAGGIIISLVSCDHTPA